MTRDTKIARAVRFALWTSAMAAAATIPAQAQDQNAPAEAQTVVVELLAVSETEFDASVVLDDAEDGPDAVRVFLTPESARQFAARSNRVISAGRPPCPLCDEPLDPDGHICVRTNGYRRGALTGPDDDDAET